MKERKGSVVEAAIRLATVADVQQIAELQVESWQQAYRGLMPDAFLAADQEPGKRAKQWAGRLSDPALQVLVAEAGPRLYGFCALCRSRDPDAAPDVGEIAAIYVHPLAWRKGYGSALLKAARGLARERAFRLLTLWVLETNVAACAFYEAHGFHADGHRKDEPIHDGSLPHLRYATQLSEEQ